MSHGVTCPFSIDRHPADCQCADCMAGHTDWTNTLTPRLTSATVAGGEQPGASADTSVSRPGCSTLSPLRRDAGAPRRAGEAEVVTAARPLVVKEILTLLGDDLPSPTQHAKYLATLPFSELCARRDQLLAENQERRQEEELRREPELPVRPLRQKQFFYGRQS